MGFTQNLLHPHYFVLALVVISIFSPIFYMINVSLKPNKEALEIPPSIFPKVFTFSGYIKVFSNFESIKPFINSIIVSLAVTGISVVFGSLAGYGISRFKFRGKNAIIFFILILQMIPPIFLLVPYFTIMLKIGLYDTYLGLIITYISFTLPFCTLMLRSFFDSISRSIDEAALIDGCSWWSVLFKVIMPINIPSIIATGSFAFILSWTELMFAIILTESKGMRLFTVALSSLIGQYFTDWNHIMSFSVTSCIPLVIAWVLLQKYIIEGLTAGAVKY